MAAATTRQALDEIARAIAGHVEAGLNGPGPAVSVEVSTAPGTAKIIVRRPVLKHPGSSALPLTAIAREAIARARPDIAGRLRSVYRAAAKTP